MPPTAATPPEPSAPAEQLYRAVYRAASRVVDTTVFLMGLYDEATQTVAVVKQVERGVDLPSGSFPLGTGFTSQVIRTRQPLLIRDWSKEGPPIKVLYGTEADRLIVPLSGITVPVLAGDRVVGVLSVQSHTKGAYDERDLAVMEALAEQVAAAIEGLRRGEDGDEALRRQLQELEAVLADIGEGFLVLDREGSVTRLNRAARDLLAIDEMGLVVGQPLVGDHWGGWPLGAAAIAAALAPIVEAMQRGERLRDFEVEQDGARRRVLSFSGAPVYDAARQLAGGVIVFRDVTWRREIERLKEYALSLAADELRSSTGASQLLDRLDLLVEISRLELEDIHVHPAPADLVAVARAAVAEAERSAPDVNVVARAPAALEGVWDADRLRRVMRDLLANAITASPRGGLVELSIETDGRNATVRVRDEGPGLAAEEVAHVFERFLHPDETGLEGRRLRLYVARAIVGAHGGRLWAESPGRGSGSTFAFTIPRSR